MISERLNLFELDCKYGNGDWAINPKYDEVWLDEKLITWEQLRKWFSNKMSSQEVDIDFNPQAKILKIKTNG
jgi:hypothetical protein